MRRLVPLLLIAAVALLAVGCGSDDASSTDATPTEEWADSLCSAVATWKTAITDVGDSLQESGLSEDGLQSAADDAKSATDTLLDDLRNLGRPDTEAGQEAQEALSDTADQLSEDLETVESTFEDASGVSEIVAAIATIGPLLTSMQTAVTSLTTTLGDLDPQGEIENAFESSSSCDGITT